MMLSLIAAALAASAPAPLGTDFAPGGEAYGATWNWNGRRPVHARPGRKMRHLDRYMIREAQLERRAEDWQAIAPAAARMEDARGRCDRRLAEALESGDQQALAEARDFCKPHPYGPLLR